MSTQSTQNMISQAEHEKALATQQAVSAQQLESLVQTFNQKLDLIASTMQTVAASRQGKSKAPNATSDTLVPGEDAGKKPATVTALSILHWVAQHMLPGEIESRLLHMGEDGPKVKSHAYIQQITDDTFNGIRLMDNACKAKAAADRLAKNGPPKSASRSTASDLSKFTAEAQKEYYSKLCYKYLQAANLEKILSEKKATFTAGKEAEEEAAVRAAAANFNAPDGLCAKMTADYAVYKADWQVKHPSQAKAKRGAKTSPAAAPAAVVASNTVSPADLAGLLGQ